MAKRKRLLIVEDEGLVALDLKNRLEEIGYSVPAIVDNMDDAVAAAALHVPDLALVDIRIKGARDGIETADLLRKDFDIPSIFVTAYSDIATLERAAVADPFGYIVKPFANIDFRPQIEIALWKHEMERKLRRSEAWLSAVVRNVGDAVIATDADGQIVAINAAASELTGFDVDEAKGRPLLEVFCAFHHETGLPLLTPLETLYQGGQLQAETQKLLLKNRKQDVFRLVEARISPNWEPEKLLGVIVTFRDVTEQSREENRERQMQRIRAAAGLASGVGQELHELLSKIATAIGSKTDSQLPGWLDRAKTLARQLEEHENAEPAAQRAVELNQLLERLKPKFAEIFEGRRELKFSLQDKLPAVEADAKAIRKILVDTMAELHSLMRRKGSIQISTEANRDWTEVTLTIEDLGKPPKPDDPQSGKSDGLRTGPMLVRVHYHTAMEGGRLQVSNRMHDGIERTTLTFVFPAATPALCVLADRNTPEKPRKAS